MVCEFLSVESKISLNARQLRYYNPNVVWTIQGPSVFADHDEARNYED